MDSVKAGNGLERHGLARQSRRCKVSSGMERLGLLGQGSQGGSRRGALRSGAVVGVRQSRRGNHKTTKEENMGAFTSKYAWKRGYQYKVSADTVGGVLNRIEKEEGKVTRESFLDYSRNENSETHEMFEWDDTVAAEKYRLATAGKIINQLEVTIVYEESEPREIKAQIKYDDEPQQKTVSAFLNVSPKTPTAPAVYYNAHRAMSDEDTRRQVLRNAMFELRAFERKYHDLEEFAELFEVIKKVTNEQIIT